MRYKGSLMGWVEMMAKTEGLGPMTKKRFGEVMHDPDLSEDYKLRYLERVEGLGGYAALADEE